AAAMACTTAGSVVGALVLYWGGVLVGRDRMRALVTRLPLVKLDDLDRTEAWFARHGAKAVFFGRMVPIFRSLISVPAGLERMRMRTFLLYTTLGSALWNTAFITAGYVLGDNWRTVERYLGIYSKAVLALFVLAVAAFAAVRVVRSRRHGKGRPGGHRARRRERAGGRDYERDRTSRRPPHPAGSPPGLVDAVGDGQRHRHDRQLRVHLGAARQHRRVRDVDAADPAQPSGRVDRRPVRVRAELRGAGGVEGGQVQVRGGGHGGGAGQLRLVPYDRGPGQPGEHLLGAGGEQHPPHRDDGAAQPGGVLAGQVVAQQRPAPGAADPAGRGVGDHRPEHGEPVGARQLAAQGPAEAGQRERAHAGRARRRLDEDPVGVQLLDADAL